MNVPFPFGLEPAAVIYRVLYLLTLVVHWLLTAYVLAGSLQVAWATVFPGTAPVPRGRQPLAERLRDWLPFMLSGAITAGVAPLLFVQLIYRQPFYTANLLLGWRWMVVVPVLIVAFYLLYLLKSRTMTTWPLWLRGLTVAGTAACFVFVAFCWTANHLLSINAPHWATAYTGGPVVAAWWPLLARLGFWLAGTFPLMSVLAGWQLLCWPPARLEDPSERKTQVPLSPPVMQLALLAAGGLLLATSCGVLYFRMLPEDIRQPLTGPAGVLWLWLAGGGAAAQLGGWLLQFRQRKLTASGLWLAFLGTVTTTTAVAVLREIIRYVQIDPASSERVVSAAAQTGGLGVFLAFTVLNGLLMAYCVRLVIRK